MYIYKIYIKLNHLPLCLPLKKYIKRIDNNWKKKRKCELSGASFQYLSRRFTAGDWA